MKKNYTFVLLAAAALLFSCAKEMPVNDIDEKPIEEIDPWTPVLMKEVAALPGKHSSVAGFGNDETKAHLATGGSYVSVLWDATDEYKMLGFKDDGWSQSTLYTYSSGPFDKATFSTTYSIGSDYTVNKLHSVYPSTALDGLYSVKGKYFLGVTIPKSQVATEGNVAPGANVAYAQSDTQDEDLHFKNAVALIKFSLTGGVVSQLKSVSIGGNTYLTGTLYLDPASSTPAYDASSAYDGSYTATLTGSFTAGKEYYIAVAPGVHDGFMMTFTKTDGTKLIKKFSNKSLTLNRGVITNLNTIALGDEFPASDPTTLKYMTATAGASKPVTIVVVPDGYQKDDLDDYETAAKAGIDALFKTEPYKSYKTYFNVWILKVASNESGATLTDGAGNVKTAKDTYFQSKWGPGYKDMDANASKVFGFVENNCPDIVEGTLTMDKISILILINEDRYGGICHSYSNGQNYCLVPVLTGTQSWSYMDTEAYSVDATPTSTRTVSAAEKTEMGVNSSGTWKNTLVHEFGGHAFGRLGDEYWHSSYYTGPSAIPEHSWPVKMDLNLSSTKDAASVPWKVLLENKASLVSSNTKYSRIDVYQGGDDSMFYRWRSERISCMIDNRFYFSTWQRWLIVNRILTLSGGSEANLATFLSHDNPSDPLRDGGSPSLLPDGLVNSIPPRPVPMCPPPVMHVVD